MATAINFDGEYGDKNRPLGMDVAGREFIRAFLRYSTQQNFPCVCPNEGSLDQFKKYARMEQIDPKRCFGVNQNDSVQLKKAGHLFRYDPNIVKHIWTRRKLGQKLYSISGLVHSSSTNNVMEIIGQYLIAPTQSWDALICPSNSIKSAILNAVEHWQQYMKERTNSTFNCPMQFPVVPLGIDSQHFHQITGSKQRIAQRNALELETDEIAVLFAGRLNYFTKANPLALMLGVEEAAIKTKTPVRLIFCGYFNDEMNETAFKEAAENVCNLTRVSFVQHGDPVYPDGFWAGADIFCSLVDNIQESFGLTPIEAMASGLPVIVSDWNGYRDTVRDGVDGYTIPTLAPRKGLGEDIAYKYFSGQYNYGDYLGATQQTISVNFDALSTALVRLIEIPHLRQKMGVAGKQRVNSLYNWPRIISAYEELWLELEKRRLSNQEISPVSDDFTFHPSYPDPFKMFESFPSHHLSEEGKVELVTVNWSEAIKLISLKVSYVNPDPLVDLEEIPFLFGHLEKNSRVSINSLINLLPKIDQNKIMLTLAWLVKLGICRYYP